MPRPTFFALPEEKRKRVVDAAVDEFSTRPYHTASLDRVAKVAKIAKGSLYQYFDDKQDLYRWLLNVYLPEVKSRARPPQGGDVFEWLEQAFLVGLDFFTEQPHLAALGARSAAPASDLEAQAIHDANQRQTHVQLCLLIDAAQQRGEIDRSIAVPVAADLIAMLMGTTLVTALARSVDATLNEVLTDPRRLAAVPADARTKLTHDARVLLERALGSRSRQTANLTTTPEEETPSDH